MPYLFVLVQLKVTLLEKLHLGKIHDCLDQNRNNFIPPNIYYCQHNTESIAEALQSQCK